MTHDDLQRAIEELKAAFAASVRNSDRTLGRDRPDAALVERLRRSPGPIGDAMRRAEDDLLREIRALAPVPTRRESPPRERRLTVRLSLEGFRYRTLGR